LSNGIITVAVAAGLLVWLFDAQVTRLIQLYIVGVFVSFTLGQLGMVRHWSERLGSAARSRDCSRYQRSHPINAFGFALSAVSLVTMVPSESVHAPWILIALMALLSACMRDIRRHYDAVATELAVDDVAAARALRSRVHAVVLVSKVHRPTLRALGYARATRH